MVVNQFKRGTGGSRFGFVAKDGSVTCFGKVGEWSGLKPSDKPYATPKLIKITLPNPITPVRDGVIRSLWELLLGNKCVFQNLTISGTQLIPFPTSLVIPFLEPLSHPKRKPPPTRKFHLKEGWGSIMSIVRGMGIRLVFSLGGREMNDGFLSRAGRTWTAPLIMYMLSLFRDVRRGLEVFCLLLLGLRRRDQVVNDCKYIIHESSNFTYTTPPHYYLRE
jgi:hypothetical protein